MPSYLWRCEHCQVEATVIRKYAEYEVPPNQLTDTDTGKVYTDSVVPDCTGELHNWKRELQVPMQTLKWPSTSGPVKGYA